MRGSKSRDHHIPLQVHQRCLSEELRLQRCPSRQPARGRHPVGTQEGPRVREEHHQPQTLQVCISNVGVMHSVAATSHVTAVKAWI